MYLKPAQDSQKLLVVGQNEFGYNIPLPINGLAIRDRLLGLLCSRNVKDTELITYSSY